MGRLAEAARFYQDVLARDPVHFDALHMLGVMALQNADPARAAALLDRATRITGATADAQYNFGTALRRLRRPGEALTRFDTAIMLRPDHMEAHFARGNTLWDLQRLPEALACYDKVITLRPDFGMAHINRGNTLWNLKRHDEALASFDRAIMLKPDDAKAFNNRGNVLLDMGRAEAALASYAKAASLNPDYAGAHFNQSLCHLVMGEFTRGWELYEWRWKERLAHRARGFPGRPWLGDFPIEGKTILVHAEQGLGDSLQFCRYVPMLARLGAAAAVLEVPPPLTRLLRGLDGVSAVVAAGDPLPRFDAWTPMMSLPLAFRTTLETIPAEIPYLFADPERTAAFRDRLAGLPGHKIGLVWSGAPRPEDPLAYALDRQRSIALDQFAPLTAIDGLCLVSLQKGDAATQARTLPPGMVLHDWTGELEDFAATAALISALDLVVSVDTSVVHLAGALGKPVWVLNRSDQCWRWLRDRTDSPWYPSARLFQQTSPGDWDGVMRDVAAALRLLIEAGDKQR